MSDSFSGEVLACSEPTIRFYGRLGAKAMNEWTVFRVGGSTLEELAHLWS